MKVKYSVIPFILAVIATVGLKLMSIFGLDGSGMFLGMNKMGITYAVIGVTLALFLVCVIINIFDRKTAPVYPVKKNYIAGVFAVLAGASVAASAITTLLNTANDSEYYLMTVVCAALSIPAAIALILMSKVHFTGKSTVSGVSMLFIFPALWGCSELVSEFLVATKVSISASDMTPLFCYIFITLYYFSHSMIVSRIKGRNPVKACFIYGLPAVAVSLSYGLYVIFTAMIEGTLASQILFGAELIIFSIYALSFIVEMTFNTYTKDEIEIIDGMPDDEDTYENSYVRSGGYDELVFAEKKDAGTTHKNESKTSDEIAGLDDFVIGYGAEDDKEPIPYLTKKEMKKATSSRLVFYNDDSEEKSEPVAEPTTPAETENIEAEEPAQVKQVEPKAEEPAQVKKPKPEAAQKPAPKKEPEKKLSDIDLLLQELDSKK
ncbi:hypothetical protein [Ruminococcus sp.]|uniref:hypothetical protein n=1 Tax=Ruminococcus sp. TaxID=41978 RepID=UPI003F11928F